MKRNLGEIWKEKEGSKIIWKVQFPKGIMSFNTKKAATKWVSQLKKDFGIYYLDMGSKLLSK